MAKPHSRANPTILPTAPLLRPTEFKDEFERIRHALNGRD